MSRNTRTVLTLLTVAGFLGVVFLISNLRRGNDEALAPAIQKQVDRATQSNKLTGKQNSKADESVRQSLARAANNDESRSPEEALKDYVVSLRVVNKLEAIENKLMDEDFAADDKVNAQQQLYNTLAEAKEVAREQFANGNAEAADFEAVRKAYAEAEQANKDSIALSEERSNKHKAFQEAREARVAALNISYSARDGFEMAVVRGSNVKSWSMDLPKLYRAVEHKFVQTLRQSTDEGLIAAISNYEAKYTALEGLEAQWLAAKNAEPHWEEWEEVQAKDLAYNALVKQLSQPGNHAASEYQTLRQLAKEYLSLNKARKDAFARVQAVEKDFQLAQHDYLVAFDAVAVLAEK